MSRLIHKRMKLFQILILVTNVAHPKNIDWQKIRPFHVEQEQPGIEQSRNLTYKFHRNLRPQFEVSIESGGQIISFDLLGNKVLRGLNKNNFLQRGEVQEFLREIGSEWMGFLEKEFCVDLVDHFKDFVWKDVLETVTHKVELIDNFQILLQNMARLSGERNPLSPNADGERVLEMVEKWFSSEIQNGNIREVKRIIMSAFDDFDSNTSALLYERNFNILVDSLLYVERDELRRKMNRFRQRDRTREVDGEALPDL